MALIRLDPDRTLGRVDRRIFGLFVEHLGRCIYGGLYEPGSELADAQGFRTDVLQALGELDAPLLRWPGGNFVSGYHWADGVGRQDGRPRRLDRAWHGEEPNTFGTDEFMAYCRTLGTEPYLCFNMGTGTLEEACAWVEYCNGDGGTEWADQRRRNGHPEPYGVRYWGLGNEMYGEWQIGSLEADEYVKEARRWVNALRRTDPSIKLVSCGRDGLSDWDRVVIDGLIKHVDHHSIHLYTGSEDHLRNLVAPLQAERALRVCGELIERARYLQKVEHPVTVAYDEWNVWFRERSEVSGLEERYTLSDALAVATYLNIFVRRCRTLGMANLAQAVNVIAPLVTNPAGLFRQTIYHPFRLASRLTQEIALDALTLCPTLDGPGPPSGPWAHRVDDLGPFAALDVAASRDVRGERITVAIVNRGLEPLPLTLEAGPLRGDVVVHCVDGPEVSSANSFEEPDLVAVSTRRIPVEDPDQVQLTLGPHTATYVEMTRALG